MKYNILTVLSENYHEFGKLFTNSLSENIGLDNINEIMIYDTGLSKKSIDYYLTFSKVKVTKTNDTENSLRVHDGQWENKTYSKPKYLLDYIEGQKSFYPTILIDCDVIFLENFFDLIDEKADIVTCRRNSAGRAVGHIASSTHIGCFVCINNKERVDFIKDWISTLNENIKYNIHMQKESPALSDTIARYADKFLISDIDERIIANIEHKPPLQARVLHLKSDAGIMTVDTRIRQPKALPWYNRYS
jgi:hypothetical protein